MNYEVMGANIWRHVSSLQAMGAPQRLYLTNGKVSRRYYLLSTGRASYARDMSRRSLLTPGGIAEIPFDRAFLFSKRIAKGSR